jgi:predicted Rossmann fold flavoprotein
MRPSLHSQGQQIVVIGGGAAGLMAAGQAASAGAPVWLLERTARLGTKLRITGKGRCNLTNKAELDEFLAHFAFPDEASESRFFLRNAFARFFEPDLVAFFESLGVPTVVERGGRVFPVSNDAHQIAEALAHFVEQQNVRVRLRSRVVRLLMDDGRLAGIELEDGERIPAEPRTPRPAPAVMATGWRNRWATRLCLSVRPWCRWSAPVPSRGR